MFKKDNKSSTEIKAFIGKDCKFEGQFIFEGSVKIDGIIEGEIISENGVLIVGETAEIKGVIRISHLINKGKVFAEIEANKVENFAPGSIIGNVKTHSIFIQSGSIFDGECRMLRKENKVENSIIENENKIKKLEA